MADVTRADRLIALQLRFGTTDADPAGVYRQWAEDGKHLAPSEYPTPTFLDTIPHLDTRAEAVAAGRAAGYAACQADVVAFLRLPSPSTFDGELHVAHEIERGDHVGAASRAESGAA